MRLESLLALTQGTLLNTPTIHAFSSIQSRVSKLSRGDLYLDTGDEEELKEALQKGAYGIITQNSALSLFDDEVALIHVPSIEEAELKLLRFHLLPKKLKVYHAPIETLEYIDQLVKPRSTISIITERDTLFKQLWNIDDNTLLLVPTQKEILHLFPTAQSIETQNQTLLFSPLSPFECRLKAEEFYFNRLKMPQPLYTYFEQAYTFIKAQNVPYDISNVHFIPSFYVQSFNTYFEPKEFGKGARTLIFIKNVELSQLFLSLLKKTAPWSKILYLSNISYLEIGYNKPIIYEDTQCFNRLIRKEAFDYAVVLSNTPPTVETLNRPEQMKLF